MIMDVNINVNIVRYILNQKLENFYMNVISIILMVQQYIHAVNAINILKVKMN